MSVSASKEKKINFPHYRKVRLLPILINRTALFFFLMCLLTLLLYAAGTVQEFVDSTLLFLLRLYVFLSFFLTAASFFGIVLNAQRFFALKKGRYLLRAAGYLALAVFGIVTILAAVFILTVSKGNA